MTLRILTATEILEADDLAREIVPTPELGEGTAIIVRTLSGQERDDFEIESYELSKLEKNGTDKNASLRNTRARLVARCACGEDGAQLFTVQQVAALGRKSAKWLDRAFDVARRLNGIGNREVEVTVGNSEAEASDGSGSD